MAKSSSSITRIAKALGAARVARLPNVGGGAFGAARLGQLIANLHDCLSPGQGRRPGRPSRPEWVLRPKVPMSAATKRRLQALAREASTPERKVTAMQVAARILEEAAAARL